MTQCSNRVSAVPPQKGHGFSAVHSEAEAHDLHERNLKDFVKDHVGAAWAAKVSTSGRDFKHQTIEIYINNY